MYGQDFHDSWKTQLRPWQMTTQTFLGRKAAQPPRHPEVPPPSPSPVHHQILLGQLICPHCHHSSPSSLSCCMDSQLVSPIPHISQSVQLLSHVWLFATPWISTLLLKKKKKSNVFYHSLPSNLPTRISTFKLKFRIFSRPCTGMSPPLSLKHFVFLLRLKFYSGFYYIHQSTGWSSS